MTSRQKRTMKRDLEKAFEKAIETVGMENFKKTSLFGSNNVLPEGLLGED